MRRAPVAWLVLAAAATAAVAGPAPQHGVSLRAERAPASAEDPLWREAPEFPWVRGGVTLRVRSLHDGTSLWVRTAPPSGEATVSRHELLTPVGLPHPLDRRFRIPGGREEAPGAVVPAEPLDLDLARARGAADFEALAPGAAPEGFDFARSGGGPPGAWQGVAVEGEAGGRALAQTSADPTSYRFPLAVLRAPTSRAMRVSARFRAVSGAVDQAAGLVVRYVDADRYYVVRANALEGNVRLYRVVAGKREQIAGADVEVTAGAWHRLTLEARGRRLTATFDDATVLGADDDAIPDEGRGGLWTKADSVTWFDDLEVLALYDASR